MKKTSMRTRISVKDKHTHKHNFKVICKRVVGMKEKKGRSIDFSKDGLISLRDSCLVSEMILGSKQKVLKPEKRQRKRALMCKIRMLNLCAF